ADAGKSGGSSALVRETELTKSVTADGKLIVRDHVSWKNLLPGRNYRLQGSLIRKDDGKPFTVDGSPLTARVQFTPGTPDGETILDFAFDGTALFAKSRTAAESGDQSGTQKLQSMEIVAFEELYILTEDSDGQKTGDSGDGKKQDTGREYLVASHKDLQDPAQTVLLREPETPQTPGKYTDIPEEPGKSNGLEKEEKGSAKGSGRKSVTPASPQTVRNGSPVKTGDETNLAAYLLPFAMAALGITALVIAGRHRNNKR
ncbi:MAG: VaFE repeat-containing surface-anchored protein, partial [Lachnospiraceae bacterium]|nr:VaFE repeat-containing surface-anchored protein [Lachnospiraceae bacterium]